MMRIRLRLDIVSPSHITESVFIDGRLVGTLTMSHGEYQLLGALLLLGRDAINRTSQRAAVQIDPIGHDAFGNFAMPGSPTCVRVGLAGGVPR